MNPTVNYKSWILSQEIKCVANLNWAKPADSVESAGSFTVYSSFGTWMSDKTYLNAEKSAEFCLGNRWKYNNDEDTDKITEIANKVISSEFPHSR